MLDFTATLQLHLLLFCRLGKLGLRERRCLPGAGAQEGEESGLEADPLPRLLTHGSKAHLVRSSCSLGGPSS